MPKQVVPQGSVLAVDELVEAVPEGAEEREEGVAEFRVAHRLEVVVADVRHAVAEREGALDGSAHAAFVDDGDDLGVDQCGDVPVERGLGDVGKRRAELRGRQVPASELLHDP